MSSSGKFLIAPAHAEVSSSLYRKSQEVSGIVPQMRRYSKCSTSLDEQVWVCLGMISQRSFIRLARKNVGHCHGDGKTTKRTAEIVAHGENISVQIWIGTGTSPEA